MPTIHDFVPITEASLTFYGPFLSGLQGIKHAHRDAMPGRTAQTCDQQIVLVDVLPVHGNEALALCAQARQVQLLSFQRPCQGALIDACAFGSCARYRQCGLQPIWHYSQY